jgi:hypothetical protein
MHHLQRDSVLRKVSTPVQGSQCVVLNQYLF